MNIYDSMNSYFNEKLAAVEKGAKLTESVEKPVIEFEEMTIPAPFDTYYRVIRPEEYEDILGFEYDADEIKSEAGGYGIEGLQYAILKDGYDTDGEVKVVAICKDGDNTFVGINVGGQMFPVDFTEVEAQIKEVKNPLKEDLNPWDKLVKAYPELAEKPLEEAKGEDPEEDLWDRVYGELTMDGELAPSSTGKSYKFNTGAGYRYADQVWTGKDGEICVGADTLEELKAAAEVATNYADKGVSYSLRRGSLNRDKFPFIIEISVPYEEE